MIKRQDHISLYNFPLFTLISMETPLEDNLILPSEECIAYIIEGDGQVFSESEQIVAKPEQAIVSICGLTLGTMMSHLSKGNLSSIVVHFNRNLLNKIFEGEKPELWEELQTPVTQYVVQTAASELIKYYFNSIINLFENRLALTESILKLKLKEIILLLLQTDNSEYVRKIIKSLFSERQFTFKELVEAYIEKTDSIEHLAMVTNCSVSTFKRRFNQYFETTPAKYRQDLKLAKVAEQLKTSDESISSIAYDCGFTSPEHLTRLFKQKYGCSPSNYRLNFLVR